MPWEDYIERGLIGKRFILALLLIGLFAFGHISEGIVGAVIGYYFGTHEGGGSSAVAA
jgi:hypothetical protein